MTTNYATANGDLPPSFLITIYRISDFPSQPDLLHSLVTMINDAYLKHKEFEEGLRFECDLQMVEQLGESGICAVMHSGETIVATASLIKWRPPTGGPVDEALKSDHPFYYTLAEAGLSWQVKAVATVDTPETRSKGLAGQCISALQGHVLCSDLALKQGVLLWVGIAEAQTGSYWRRRGFELVGQSELKPKGFWGAYEPFWHSYLVKRIERRGGLI